MTLDRAGDVIWIVGALLLVGSALVARRHTPHRSTARMALLWVAIFLILFGVAHWIDAGR